MTLLAPTAFLLGALAAAAVVALHLLTTRRPPPVMLPTARFVPVSEARAVARASTPTDLLLLALRALAVLLIGLAFAQPVLDAPGPSVRTVVALEVSRAVADPVTAEAAARAARGEGGALVVFGREAAVWSTDSLPIAAGAAHGTLSAALVAARRAGAKIARGADSVRLVVVSALGQGSVDAATAALRAEWPGRIELVRVAAVVDSAPAPELQLRTTLADDPLAPAVAALPSGRGAHEVRIVRGVPGAADSVWAQGADRVLVLWPVRADADVAAAGVVTLGRAPIPLVAPLGRGDVPRTGAVIARWNDGAPAVTEDALEGGCVRHVGVGIPLAGDITLRAPFVRFLGAMVDPCGGARTAPMVDSTMQWLTAAGPLASARALAAEAPAESNRLAVWLLAIAVLLLLVELAVRYRMRAETSAARAMGAMPAAGSGA
jgi:hypothetical protein